MKIYSRSLLVLAVLLGCIFGEVLPNVRASEITGTVTGPDGVTPAYALVEAYSWNGMWGEYVTYSYTDQEGHYALTGLAAGTYRVMFYDLYGNYFNESYDNAPDLYSGTDILVPDGVTISNINATLSVGSKISGKITESDGVTPLTTAYAEAYSWSGGYWSWRGYTFVDLEGQYTLLGLAPGTYRVWFNDNNGNHVGEAYDNASDLYSGMDVVVLEGVTVSNINAALDQYASLGGSVVKPGGSDPVVGVMVRIMCIANGTFRSMQTDSYGKFLFNWLPPGSYVARVDLSPDGDYLAQWYNGVQYLPDQEMAPPKAELILLGSGNFVSDINFTSIPAGRVSGTVTDSGFFPISGATVQLRGLTHGQFFSGLVDDSGQYEVKGILPDTYKIKVEAPAFKDEWWENVTDESLASGVDVASGGDLAVDFTLDPGQSPALVEVTSDPSGAEVYVDYQNIGMVTPALVDVGVAASHVLGVRKAGYALPPPQGVTAIEAETITVHFDIASTVTGSLSIASAPSGAFVYVDQVTESMGVTPVMLGNLEAGSHTIILQHGGYLQARPISAMVSGGSNTEVMVPLVEDTDEAIGRQTVDVTSMPLGAEVYVDYLPIGEVTSVQVDWLDAASHSGVGWHSASHVVMVRKAGYLACGANALPDLLNGTALKIHLVPLIDTDNDGLSDADETDNFGTNPFIADSDGDGLNDGDELGRYATDPLIPDSDGDGLSDGDEVLTYETRPDLQDTDGDSLPDGWEVRHATDPLVTFTGLAELNIQKIGSYSVGWNYNWKDMALLDGQVILGGSYYDMNSWEGVVAIVSVTDPAAPQLLWQEKVAGYVEALETVGSVAYVGMTYPAGQLQVWDCANPSSPYVVQTIYDRWVSGLALGSLYVACGWYVEKYDNSSPTNLVYENWSYLNRNANQMIHHNGNLYLYGSEWTGSGYDGSLVALDSVSLGQVGACSLPGGGWKLPFAGWANTIFTSSTDWQTPSGVTAVDVGDPTLPAILGTFGSGKFSGLLVESNLLYCAGNPELMVYRVDSPTNLVRLYTSDQQWGGQKIRVKGNMIYVCTYSGVDIFEMKGLLDSDQDGLPDSWEMKWFNTLDFGPMDDFNNDGFLNGAAYLAGTDPTRTDTDGDGLPDYTEVWQYLCSPTDTDTDGDGLPDYDEVMGTSGYVTRPDLADTDNDGTSDPVEIDLGRSPLVASDGGEASTIAGIIRGEGVGLADARIEFHGLSGVIYNFGMSDDSGHFSIAGVTAGHYYVKVEADHFADEWYDDAHHRTNALPFVVPPGTLIGDFDFDLSSGQSPALVEVTSDPAGAIIYLDYQPMTNVTPAVINVGEVGSASHVLDLSGWVASHVISVKKAGSPWPGPRDVSAKEAESVSVHFDLTGGASGALSVDTDPETSGVEVFVDYTDNPVGFSPIVVGNLAPGSHTLLLRKEGFMQPCPVNASIQSSETNTIVMPLTPYAGNTGLCVSVATVPPGVFVYVDYLPSTNVTSTIVDWMDPASHSGVGWHSASHVILLTKKGFYPMAPRVVTALPGQPEQLMVFLEEDPTRSTDVDVDGLSDEWEQAYDLEGQAPGKHGADDDADGDGISNANEMAAGTNPLDKNSGLRIDTKTEIEPELHLVTFVFDTVPGRRYILQGTEDLMGGWANLSGIILANAYQTTIEVSVLDETKHAFYRVIVLTP
jgi:hypothetical protein